MHSRSHCALAVSLFLVILFCNSASAERLKLKKMKHKDDVVIMDNGDRNTGEIKKMQFGVLYLKSDLAQDTLKLDWTRVTRVQSKSRYEFETSDYLYHIGVIKPDPENQNPAGELHIVLDNGSVVILQTAEIIGIREMQRSIVGRLNLSLDAGITFTSANDLVQTNFSLTVDFQKPKYSGQLDLISSFSGEPGDTNTSRHELELTAARVLSRKWEVVGLLDFLKDKEQELDLRTTAGGGISRTIVKTNRTFFAVLGGIVYTAEDYSAEANLDRNNAEILSGMNFSTYRFRGSELNITFLIYPSLSDPGRVRMDLDSDWKWEIVKDLYWKVSVINNFDSRPPANGINNNLSLTSSVGWTF